MNELNHWQAFSLILGIPAYLLTTLHLFLQWTDYNSPFSDFFTHEQKLVLTILWPIAALFIFTSYLISTVIKLILYFIWNLLNIFD